jgi:hypothetical protein
MVSNKRICVVGAGALSDKEPAVRLAVVASDREQSVPIFQQLAGGHPSGRDDVRGRRQSNSIRRRVARHARSQAAIYAARARHSVNAIERLCL